MIPLQKYTVLIGLLLALSLNYSKAAEVSITGSGAKDYAGKKVFLLKFIDHYTFAKEQIDDAVIDEEGNFLLQMECEDIQYVEIQFNFLHANLFVQPGKKYEIEFLALDDNQSISISKKTNINYLFKTLDKDDINRHILSFNYDYDLFFNTNFETLQHLSAPPSSYFNKTLKGDSIQLSASVKAKSQRQIFELKLKDFENEMEDKYAVLNNEYFDIHRQMAFAELNSTIRTAQNDVFEEYLNGKECQFSHPEYIHFIKLFYQDYFANFSLKWGDRKLVQYINNQDLDSILVLLRKDNLIKDDKSREFVLAHALYEVENNRQIELNSIIALLDKLSNRSSYQQVAELCGHLTHKLKRAKNGYPAYNFQLKSANAESVQLSDYSGKFVLINFWADWCSSCKKEYSVLSELHKKYSKHIEFVTINIEDVSGESVQALNEAKGPNWQFLNGNSDALLLNEFEIVNLPVYVLIDKEGNFLQSRTKKPSDGLEKTLYSIHQKEELKLKGERKVGRK